VRVCKGGVGCEVDRVVRFKCEEAAFNARARMLGAAMDRRGVTFYKTYNHIYGMTVHS